MKAWQLRVKNNDETSLVWADTPGKAKAQFNLEKLGLSGWYTHDISNGIYDFTDVTAARLPKLDGKENANPKEIIKILVKDYWWESDDINLENVDKVLEDTAKKGRAIVMKEVNIQAAIDKISKFNDKLDKQGKINQKEDNFTTILPLENNQIVIFDVGPNEDGDRTVKYTIHKEAYIMSKLKNTILREL